MDEAYLQAEFDKFFEFDTADRSTVSSVSARLFAEAIAQPWECEVERLRNELAASQAYAESLREAIQSIRKWSSLGHSQLAWDMVDAATAALAIPADHAALTERLAQERERLLVEIGRQFGGGIAQINDVLEFARALGDQQ